MGNEQTKEELAWESIKADVLRTDGLIDWDKLKLLIHDYQSIEEQASIVYCTITGNKISSSRCDSNDVISIYEDKMNKLFIERPRYIDLDFTESEDWISWALNAEDNKEKITEDEKLIAQYHSTLFNYIENNKLILEKLEDIKKAKNIKEAKKIVNEIIKDNSID